MSEDYYKILEVHPEAGIEVIEKAYRALAMRYHPDRHAGHRQKWAEEKFKQLSEAYSVLKDPFLRREYDREFRAAQRIAARATSHPGSSHAEPQVNEEEAYFHFRKGLEYSEKAKKASSLEIIFGKDESDQDKAKTSFETVVRNYPQSKYAEESFYRWLKILNGTADFSEAFLRKLEEKFEEFMGRYPSGTWSAEAKLEYARFRILKRKDPREARKILHYLETYYGDTGLRCEVRALEEFVQGVEKKATVRREKVHG